MPVALTRVFLFVEGIETSQWHGNELMIHLKTIFSSNEN